MDFIDNVEALPQYEIDQAKERCKKTDEFVYEIEGLLKIAGDIYEEILEKLQQSIHSDSNPAGLLTVSMNDYKKCITLDTVKLNEHFDTEKRYWADN